MKFKWKLQPINPRLEKGPFRILKFLSLQKKLLANTLSLLRVVFVNFNDIYKIMTSLKYPYLRNGKVTCKSQGHQQFQFYNLLVSIRLETLCFSQLTTKHGMKTNELMWDFNSLQNGELVRFCIKWKNKETYISNKLCSHEQLKSPQNSNSETLVSHVAAAPRQVWSTVRSDFGNRLAWTETWKVE